MRPTLLLTLTCILLSMSIFAQVSIGGDTPPASALLELRATNKGFLPPRLSSAQRLAIAAPDEGLVVYDTNEKSLMLWNGVSWAKLATENTMDIRTNVSPAPAVTGVGLAVAMSGNDAIVASNSKVYFYTFNGSAWTLGQTLNGTGTSDSTSVAIYGHFAVLGASTSSGGWFDLFERDPATNNWVKTVSTTTNYGWRFGQSVAISDSFLVVGAPATFSRAANDGVVFFFKRTSDPLLTTSPSRSNWKLAYTINSSSYTIGIGGATAPELPPGSTFFKAGAQAGRAVAIDGDWCLIGVPGLSYNANTGRGAALMYAYNGNTWEYRGLMMPSDTTANMRFGQSIAVSNGRAVIGAPLKDAGTTASTLKVGAAYVFEARPYSGWKQTARLIFPYTFYANANFGRSVAIGDDHLVIGVNGVAPNPSNYYAIRYSRQGTQWIRKDDLTSPLTNKFFGLAMAATESAICIGEPGSGQVYFYK